MATSETAATAASASPFAVAPGVAELQQEDASHGEHYQQFLGKEKKEEHVKRCR
ncbi:hypothetical protein E2C01_100890 [Portunus trituberculatus]|uniref:Uncharacterized protein n=1 Tax=Portunus trituberculatus TaxID=210409 RepID=A0A5B7KJ25_PORTR|nr:hypothetical protein [Portunus trituberculatus]